VIHRLKDAFLFFVFFGTLVGMLFVSSDRKIYESFLSAIRHAPQAIQAPEGITNWVKGVLTVDKKQVEYAKKRRAMDLDVVPSEIRETVENAPKRKNVRKARVAKKKRRVKRWDQLPNQLRIGEPDLEDLADAPLDDIVDQAIDDFKDLDDPLLKGIKSDKRSRPLKTRNGKYLSEVHKKKADG
jgi:hypothetical protein